MRTTRLLLICGVLFAAPLRAQETAPDDAGRSGALRRLIEERFTARVQEELGLTDQQSSRLREVVGQYFGKRRAMEAEERRLRQALAAELRPGVAANPDNVARLTDQLLDLKVRYVQSYKEELHDQSAFLNPVQRAQYLILRERLLDRIREAQSARDDDAESAPVRRRRLRP
jgi:septum formation topological specificity factor MinE